MLAKGMGMGSKAGLCVHMPSFFSAPAFASFAHWGEQLFLVGCPRLPAA